jgi:hypothetical protein
MGLFLFVHPTPNPYVVVLNRDAPRVNLTGRVHEHRRLKVQNCPSRGLRAVLAEDDAQLFFHSQRFDLFLGRTPASGVATPLVLLVRRWRKRLHKGATIGERVLAIGLAGTNRKGA